MSRMDEIRARLAASTTDDGAIVVEFAEAVRRVCSQALGGVDTDLLANAPSDLAFLVSEIEAVLDLVYDEDADEDPDASLLWFVERYIKVVQQSADQAYDTAGRAIEALANERAENERQREILRQVEAALENDRARMDPGADLVSVVRSLVEERNEFGRERGVATGTQVENDRLREALRQIAEHPCPNRECACGARLALGLPALVTEGCS